MSFTPSTKALGSNSERTMSSGQSVIMATRQLQTKTTVWAELAVLISAQRDSAECMPDSPSTSTGQ